MKTDPIQAARERRALKRWLRARGVKYSNFAKYNKRALIKLVRNAMEKESAR